MIKYNILILYIKIKNLQFCSSIDKDETAKKYKKLIRILTDISFENNYDKNINNIINNNNLEK